MNDIIHCPVCEHPVTIDFVTRDHVPVHQNMVFAHRDEAINMHRGTLRLRVCDACGFIHNAAFEEAKLNYSVSYNNIQNFSARFDDHTSQRARQITSQLPPSGGTVIEVGCGKGTFLKQVFQMHPTITGYGFDPSYEGPETDMDGRLTFVQDFYGSHYAHITADVIICRHVIEHIVDPVGLLQTIRSALEASPNAKLYFETPCVHWILEHLVVCDFFYEHCSYFTADSLSRAFERAGFHVDQVSHVFGGQYLWLEASVKADTLHSADQQAEASLYPNPSMIVQLAQQFQREEQAQFARWTQQLEQLLELGPVAIWGAGAKGVTYLNLLDPMQQRVNCVVDINPYKQGGYLPGTGHIIVDVRDLAPRQIAAIIVMNSNYLEEIRQMLKEDSLSIQIAELE